MHSSPTELELVALAIALATAAFLLVLGGVSLFAPALSRRFLLGFADSAVLHYAELAVRGVVGAAFVLAAPQVACSWAFGAFGWVVLGTTGALLLVPWQWHRRFARAAVPQALHVLPLIGISSALAGALVLWCVLGGRVG